MTQMDVKVDWGTQTLHFRSGSWAASVVLDCETFCKIELAVDESNRYRVFAQVPGIQFVPKESHDTAQEAINGLREMMRRKRDELNLLLML